MYLYIKKSDNVCFDYLKSMSRSHTFLSKKLVFLALIFLFNKPVRLVVISLTIELEN